MVESLTAPVPNAVRIAPGESAQRVLLHCAPAARLKVQSQLGVVLADQMLRTKTFGAWTSLHLAPDEWLLVAHASAPGLAANGPAGTPFSLVDVSDRFLSLELEGVAAPAVLAAGCPLDLHCDAFPAQACARGPLGKVDITLWRQDTHAFTVLVARSFYPYALEFLTRAAADLAAKSAGYDVRLGHAP